MVAPFPGPLPILGPNGQPLPPSGAMGPGMSPMMPGMGPRMGMPSMMPPMGMPPMPPPAPVKVGPVYPARLLDEDGEPRKPRKPTATDCRAKALSDERKHQRLVNRFLRDLRRYRQLHKGVFDDFDPTTDEAFTTTEASIQVNKVANLGSGMPWRYEVPYRTRAEKQASRRIEAWAAHFVDTWARMHAGASGADLKWEIFFYALVYGHVVGRCACDLADQDFPWLPELLDPATTFPTFGGPKEGLTVVTQVMQKTYGAVLDEFGGEYPGLERELLGKQRKDNAVGGHADLERDKTGRFVAYCDAWWHGSWFDEVEVVPITPHEYLEVPYVVAVAPGEPGSLASPSRREITPREWRAGYRRGDTFDGWDLVEKGPSFFHHIENALLQREAVFSLLMTQAKQATNPATVVETAYEEPPEPFDFGPGGNNTLRPGERLQPIPTSPRPTDVQPLLGQTGGEIQKALLPDPMFGASDNSNVSGYAEDSMRAAARDRIVPYFAMVQRFVEGMLGLAAREYRNFGHTVTADGRYSVPYGRRPAGNAITDEIDQAPPEVLMALAQLGIGPPEDEPEVQVGIEDFDLVGNRVRVKIATMSLQNMTQMMNVAQMALNAPMPVWSWEHAAEFLNVDDPDLMWQQIVTNKAMMDPDILKNVVYPLALFKSGNQQAYKLYMERLTAPPPGAMPGMQGGGPPPGALPSGVPGPQTAQGDSQPAVDQGPGVGGRPTGPPPPPPGSQVIAPPAR